MKIVFSPVARDNINRLYHFIEQKNPSALGKAALRLKQVFRLLQKYPNAGYSLDHLPPFRELLVPFGKGNYVIRYRIEKKRLAVVHLWHSREDR